MDLLENFLSDLEKVSGVGLVLHDRGFLTRQRMPLGRYNHNCAYCRFIKSQPNGKQNCRRSDIEEAYREAQEDSEPFLRYCHANVSEVLVPVKSDGRLVAVIFCGQVFQSDRPGLKTVPRAVRDKVPHVPVETLLAVGRIVHRFFLSYEHLVDNLVDLQRPSQYGHRKLNDAMQILESEFISDLSVNDVAKRVGLSVSYFEHLFKEHITVSFTAWKRRRRIREALKLLAHTDMKVREIAKAVGYEEAAYFHRIFKEQVGMSPREYRKQAI